MTNFLKYPKAPKSIYRSRAVTPVDRLEVYPRTVYKTINTVTERKITDRKRFGIGIQAGYGINLGTGKLSPYIGIGVQYSVWRW